MENRTRDLFIVGLIYVLAIVIGGALFFVLKDLNLIIRLLVADLGAMMFIYILSLILKNASLYDAYWSVIPPVFLTIAFIASNKTMNITYFLLFFAIYFWGIRLTINWIKGWKGFNHVDWRYLMIKDKAPKIYFLTNFLAIQLLPTMIVFAQILVGLEIINLKASINVLFIVGFVMIIAATIIQYISDEQMRSFREAHKNEKKCIDEGLWKYSRHPNYFGEIVVWWGVYLMYFSIVGKFDLYILAPIAMTLLFLFVSIPMMERKILKSRPQYKEYQNKVSMLIPFIRKENKEVTTKKTS